MKEFMGVAKALADDNRTRALMCLRDGELCVCQIIELLQLAPSTVSKHLDILHRAGLIESRKEGRWIYYRLAGRGRAGGRARGAALGPPVAGEGPADRPRRRPAQGDPQDGRSAELCATLS